jgi:hypothetical protein
LRGLETKTTDPYLAVWRKRVVPTVGNLPMTTICNGAIDRVVHGWIADDCSRSTVKNSLAVLVRVMEQALRDGIIDRNPAGVTGWQREYKLAEDELDDPRALALPDWNALATLAELPPPPCATPRRGTKSSRKLGYEHLKRHRLRHTGLTGMADAGVPVHTLRKIVGHGALTTTQR